MALTLKLPYPPSVNRYWRRLGNRTVLSRAARQYRRHVADLWFVQKYIYMQVGFDTQPVAMSLVVKPPDKRRRDLDNVLKAIFDAIEHSNIIADDSQIKKLVIEFGEPCPPGSVVLSLSLYEPMQ